VNLYNARADRIAERQRGYMGRDAKLSSWEELDKSLFADDVRGGFAAPLGGVGMGCRRARPQHLRRSNPLAEEVPIKKPAILRQSAKTF